MANDRILLYCKKCKEVQAIASYAPFDNVRMDTPSNIESFINKHLHEEDNEDHGIAMLENFPVEIFTEGNWPVEKYGPIPYKSLTETEAAP